MERISLTFKNDGTCDIRYPDNGKGREGNVEEQLKWLWEGIGPVEVRGHQPHGHGHEETEVHQH